MTTPEFALIARHFSGLDRADGVVLGIGDDAALIALPGGASELAVTVDTLVEGVHFRPGCDPEALGHKLLAVNLSDLAAMGAAPRWATLALTLPRVDDGWLAALRRGFERLAAAHAVALVGGDTTRGPLTLTLQVAGEVPAGQALRRSGARPGDAICVTGTLGDAALALRDLAGIDATASERLVGRLERPEPRIAAGLALRGRASAAIDISDGLAADLGHILGASGVGATVELARLPLSPEVAACAAAGDWALPLGGGDDYELCFCVAEGDERELAESLARLGVPVARIGTIETEAGLRLVDPAGRPYDLARAGYDHFAAPGAT